MDTSTLINDIRRAVTFDANFYRQAANDDHYSQQALTIVMIVAALSGVGTFLRSIFSANFIGAIVGLVLGVGFAIIGYFVWVYVVQYVGAQFFQGRATVPQLQRTLGYAYVPTVLSFFTFIPCLGGLVALAGSLWALACGFFAVREVHQLDDGKTLLTVIIGWVVVMVIAVIIGLIGAIFGAGAMGFGALFGG
jgi:hypothetical protein